MLQQACRQMSAKIAQPDHCIAHDAPLCPAARIDAMAGCRQSATPPDEVANGRSGGAAAGDTHAMSVLFAFGALFASVVLLQLSAGGIGPLDALSGAALGFSPTEIGLLGSAHFLGFLIGCWGAPRLMGRVGHARAFAAFTAAGTIGALAHMLVTEPLAWAGMRVLTGLCVAGCYTVIEAWLQARLDNANRGRAMGTYRLVDLVAQLGAQGLIGVLPPAAYASYNVLAIFAAAALLPMTLTRTSQPPLPAAPRLRPLAAIRLSPLAAAGVVTAGLTGGAFRMVGPIYGQEVGLSADQIALFLAAFILGGALAQLPVGWLADRYDRRWVLIGLSLAAIAACAGTVAAAEAGTGPVFAAAVAFGLVTFPVYSVATAHANDFARPEEAAELSSALVFLFAIGAIASPLVAAGLIGALGPWAMFAFIALAHLVLSVFGVIRMRARAGATARTAYVYTPRTTAIIGRILRNEDKD
jgi:MFS family permease